ncbi:hypothetical protein MIMGU_mgv1a025125mg, partial [Erythranthe guttata]
WVQRGINLAVGGDGRIGDHFVVITTGEKRVETRVVANGVNPEWDDKLRIVNSSQSHQVTLTVYDQNKLSNIDEKIGEAEFDIGPLVEATKMNPNGFPNGTIIRRIMPSCSNCLAKESFPFWKDGIVMQKMCLKLKNVECGEIELLIWWVI